MGRSVKPQEIHLELVIIENELRHIRKFIENN